MTAQHPLRATSERERLRILVVGDDALARASLVSALAADPTLEIVEDATRAQVALVDGAPGSKAGSAAPPPGVRRLVLVEDESSAHAALIGGAVGVLARRAEGPRLAAALKAVAAGLTVLDFAMGLPRHSSEPLPPLTQRESQVLGLIAAGLSNRRIARRLSISEHTAKFHVNGVMTKLDARTRTEAVVRGARLGLVTL